MTATVVFVLGLFSRQTGVTAHHPPLIALSFLKKKDISTSQLSMMAETSVLVVLQFINVVALVVVDVDDIISFVLLLFFVSVATIRGHSPLHWEIIGTQPWIQI